MRIDDWRPVRLHGADGAALLVLLCEHAALAIPAELDGLGLTGPARRSHAAWDIGALDVARRLSEAMDAPLVAGGVSRLVYDCNRPLEAPDCIPTKSGIYDIPGNAGLSDEARRRRFTLVHEPFHAAAHTAIEAQTARAGRAVRIVTIHSFTPLYRGERRELDLGFLYDGAHGWLAEAALRVERGRGIYRAALNAPYDADDGVTYSLGKHAGSFGAPSVMIEIRNDLIDTPEKAVRMADHLSQTLTLALEDVAGTRMEAR